MGAELEELAHELGVNERTLRRAWATGSLRGTRRTPYRLEVPLEERLYLRRHWPTLGHLRRVLRTEPNVALAVVFGSFARGDDAEGSDVDLLVALRDRGLASRVAVRERLHRRTSPALDVLELEDAMRRPSLMLEILREGRVLVDREGRWPRLQAQGAEIAARARRERGFLTVRAREAAEVFAQKAGGRR